MRKPLLFSVEQCQLMERINAWTPLYVAIDRLCSKPYDDFCGSVLKPVELTFFVISLIDKLRNMPWNNGVSPQVSRTVGDLRMLMEYELKGLSKKQVQSAGCHHLCAESGAVREMPEMGSSAYV